MSHYPYDEELRKVPLNPEMIRYRVHRDARHSLIVGAALGTFLAVACGLCLGVFCSSYPWQSGTIPLIFGLLLALAVAAGVVIGVLFFGSSVINYRRAARGEIVIELDRLSYIEHDRPRIVRGKGYRRTVYEDFLHFKSGREFRDPRLEYRHRSVDGEEFITVAYAAEYDTILCIYRLADYNWQA